MAPNTRNKYKKKRFSKEDEKKLIGWVKTQPILWDVADRDFKNNIKKNELWKVIADELKQTGKYIYIDIYFSF